MASNHKDCKPVEETQAYLNLIKRILITSPFAKYVIEHHLGEVATGYGNGK